ncbi:MAG: LuxR C-terminal-related transcriptional regulator [Bdellovibrionota bacterium]
MKWQKDMAQLFANTADGVWVSGPEGEIFFWNEAAENILGYSAAEVAGRPCREIFCGRDGSGNRICSWPCPIKGQLREGEAVQHFDMMTRTKAGETVWLDVSCISFPSNDGRIPTVVHLFRDVTAARQIGALVRKQLSQGEPAGLGDSAEGLSDKLTQRELEVIGLMRTGATTADIADRLSISRATVRNHVQNIFSKLKVHSRLEAVAYANRLIPQEAAAGA